MDTLLINLKGKEFIELRKKKIKQFIIIFPFLTLFSLSAGIIKLGFSGYSIWIIFLILPVLFIVLKTGILKPQKMIENLIVKIELNDGVLSFMTENEVIKSLHVKSQSNLQIFETTFHKYYTVNFNANEFYLIPDFFDNFKAVENILNQGGT